MQGEARIYEYDDEGNPTESVRVSYKVTLNPSAQQLGTEEYLEAYDTLSDGLTLIESSVHVEPSDLGVTWKPCDCEGHPHTLDFEHIPNATTVTITYTAVFDHGGLQTFGNTIQFDTYLKVKTDEVHVTEEGQSGGHLSALNLYKYDEDDHSSRLGGAEFTLFDDTTGPMVTYCFTTTMMLMSTISTLAFLTILKRPRHLLDMRSLQIRMQYISSLTAAKQDRLS